MSYFLRISKVFFCFILFFSLTSTGYAANLTPDNATLKKLSKTNAWWRLIHYKQHTYGVRSQVDQDEFFLNPKGYKSPLAELKTTFEKLETALNSPSLLDQNQDLRCTYPARVDWLARTLDLNIPPRACTGLDKWLGQVDAGSMSMIFPSAYMNNASSMFGHSFLRLEGSDRSVKPDLVAHAINFAADVSEADGGISYAVKGMFGMYPGYFTLMPYYEKVDEYNNLENRDMWEYPMNLSDDGLERVILHMWELERVRFDYWFFDENCSYQLLALISVAEDHLDLTDGFDLKALPADTIRALDKANLIGEKAKYRPSFATKLISMSEQANPAELTAAKQLVFDYLPPSDLKLDTTANPAKVYELAYEWLNFRFRHQGVTRDEAANQLHKLLVARSKIRQKSGILPPEAPIVPPHKGHKTAQLALSLGQHERTNYLQLSAKPSYHGRYDSLDGYLPNAEINLLELKLRFEEKSKEITPWHLNILEVGNYLQSSPIFSLAAWRVKAEVGRTHPLAKSKDDWRGRLGASYGRAWGRSDNIMGYLMLAGELEAGSAAGHLKEYKDNQDWALGGGVTGGFVWEPITNWRTGLDASWIGFATGNQGTMVTAEATLQWNYQTNQSLRLVGKWEERRESNGQVDLAWLKFF